MKRPIAFIQIFLISCLLFIMSGCVKTVTTEHNEVGVLVVKWNPFGKQGVMEKWYPEGETHFVVPFLTDWFLFTSTVQNIEMTYSPKTGDVKARDDLLFKTVDGNDIGLDVIISYQIIRNKAPFILRSIASNDKELRNNIVRTISRSKPRDIFGELTTEEFYVAENREKKSQQAIKELNRILNPYGVTVVDVLTKDYRFNTFYQKAIEERKIADQMAEKNKAAARAAEEEYKKKIQDAIGEVNKMRADVDGEFERGKLEADAYYNSQMQISKAIEKEGQTEAEAIKQMADALEGSGGEILVKMKVAEALNDKQIFLLPLSGGGLDLKTTDINRLLETYGLQKAAQKATQQTSETSIPKRLDITETNQQSTSSGTVLDQNE